MCHTLSQTPSSLSITCEWISVSIVIYVVSFITSSLLSVVVWQTLLTYLFPQKRKALQTLAQFRVSIFRFLSVCYTSCPYPSCYIFCISFLSFFRSFCQLFDTRVPLYLNAWFVFSVSSQWRFSQLFFFYRWHLRVHKKVRLSWCVGACVPECVRVRCEVTGTAGGSVPLKILTLSSLCHYIFRSTLLFASLSLSPHLLHWSHCPHSVSSGVCTAHTLDRFFVWYAVVRCILSRLVQ